MVSHLHSKERSDLSDSLLPCNSSDGAGYDGIRPTGTIHSAKRAGER